MTNRPMKNTSVGHSTSSRNSGRVQLGEGDERPGAEQGDHRRLDVQGGVGDETDHDERENDARPDQQPPVADHLTLVQGHERGHALGVVV